MLACPKIILTKGYCANRILQLLKTKPEETSMTRPLISLLLMLLISACGKTGDLYLPDAEPAAGTENIEIEPGVK